MMRFAPIRGWIRDGPQPHSKGWVVLSDKEDGATPVIVVRGHDPAAWRIEWACGHRRFTDDFKRVQHWDAGACPHGCPDGEFAGHQALYGEEKDDHG